MRRRWWVILAAWPLLLAGTCEDSGGGGQTGDDGGVTDPFAGHVACADRGLRQYRKTLNGLWRVIDHVAEPGRPLDPAVTLDPVTLEFEFHLALAGAIVDARVDGEVEPNGPGEMRCRDGMTQSDVCLFTWETAHLDDDAEIGNGVLSALALGTEGSLRWTLARENTMVLVESFAGGAGTEGCMLEVSGLDLMVRRLGPADGGGLEMYALSVTADAYFGSAATVSPIRGYVTWGESTGTPTIALHAGGEVRTCGFDLDTFAVDCP